MRVPYRTYPGPNNTVQYYPLLRVRVGRKYGPTTRFFEALVDSGASDCMFPEDVAQAIGINDITTGRKSMRAGIGGKEDVWIHSVVVYVGEHALDIEAAFTHTLPVSGLLGRQGFFEHFRITFDPTGDPPGLEIERVHKA